MKRIKLILATAAALTTMTVVAAVPASAEISLGDGDLGFDGTSGGVLLGDGGFFVVGDRDRDRLTFEEPFFVPEAAGLANQEFSESRITSGGAAPSFTLSNTGDNANLAPTDQQVVNTGNVANEQGVVQSGSVSDDITFSGSSIELSPSTTSDVTQTIEQSGAAS